MQQYFGMEKDKNNIFLNPKDFNHIKNVMRMKEGEEVFVVYNNKRYIASLNSDFKSAVIKEELKVKTRNKEIIIYVPLLNDDKMSFIFQKATELGATKFVPVEFEHCKYKLDLSKKLKKIERWRKIIIEASEQSYRNDIPELDNFATVSEIKSVKGMNMLCSLDTNRVKSINTVLNSQNICDKITVVFGPEGGFTEDEEMLIKKNGFQKVSLGKNILRSETVPLFVISVIKYLEGCE